MLNVNPKTIYQWAELGQIPHYKINGCVRFDPEEVKTWLESCCKREPLEGYNPIIQARGPRKGGN